MGIFDFLKNGFHKVETKKEIFTENENKIEQNLSELPIKEENEVKQNFNQSHVNQQKEKHCIRCNKIAFLNSNGHCKECESLKNKIETITSPEHLIAKDTNDLYSEVKNANTYEFSKLDIENAQITNQLNGIEKKFLDYISTKPADHYEIAGYWIYEHFIDCNYLISKFLKNGFLEIIENQALEDMNANDLKAILKSYNLKVGGTKTNLIQRIRENLTTEQINSLSNGKKYFKLTEKGRNITDKIQTTIAHDIDFENNCYELILSNNLNEAYKLVCNYECNKLVKRGIGSNWEYEANRTDKKTFHLYIDTKLPFNLPNCLKKYEKELKATAIYAQMMGAGEVKAKSFFVNRYEIDFDKKILDTIFHALCFLAMGVNLPSDFIIQLEQLDNKIEQAKNLPVDYFKELSIEKFIEELKLKLQENGYNPINLHYDQHNDGTCNFVYKDFQIGRIKFGKKSSKMQILSMDFVSWIENETMEEYIKNINKWIKYLKEIEETNKIYEL